MNSIRLLIREILAEDAYKERMGHRFVDDIKLVKNSVDKEGYFLHFSDVPKIGINPKSSYFPGVYFYPNIRPIYNSFFADVFGDVRGQARAARYVYLVKLRPGLNILDGNGISKNVQETMSKIVEPFMSADLEISEYFKNQKGFDGAQVADNSGSPRPAYIKYPSLEEIKSSGLMNLIERNAKELFEIYKFLKVRPKMSEEKKIEFLKKYHQLIANFFAKLGAHLEKYDVFFYLEKLDAKKIDKVLGSIAYHLRPYKIDASGNNIVLDEQELQQLLKSHERNNTFKPLTNGTIKSQIFTMTIENWGGTSAIYAYAANMKRLQPPGEIFQFIKWLYKNANNPRALMLKNGETVPLSDLIAQSIEQIKTIFGKDYEKFKKTLDKDSVGTLIMLAMRDDVDGLNDTGFDFDWAKTDRSITQGLSGVLGSFESRQLILKAPVQNKIEIITMIDRFEGVPDTKKIPGSHTPDASPGERTTNPRYQQLKSRFGREVPDVRGKKTVPRERWSSGD